MALITCPDCENKISDAAPACPKCGRPNIAKEEIEAGDTEKRALGPMLGIGIVTFPFIFAWLTLRQGYSSLAKRFSFTWLVFYILAYMLINILTAPPTEPIVNWADYSPQVKARVDSYIANKDCSGFQTEFDAAADNSQLQRQRIGKGNINLMDFIYYHANKSGC